MAAVIIPVDVGDAYRLRLDVDLSGVEVTIRLQWRDASAGWYLSAALPDGTSLRDGARLCTGAEVPLDLTVSGAPSGRLYCLGSLELTMRDRLGVTSFLAWVS
jgi:hypothetical protein